MIEASREQSRIGGRELSAGFDIFIIQKLIDVREGKKMQPQRPTEKLIQSGCNSPDTCSRASGLRNEKKKLAVWWTNVKRRWY